MQSSNSNWTVSISLYYSDADNKNPKNYFICNIALKLVGPLLTTIFRPAKVFDISVPVVFLGVTMSADIVCPDNF